MNRSIRVLLADDNAAYRRGLRECLDSADGFEVVGEAENGDEAVRMAAALRPDVVLMNLRMPDPNGVRHDSVGLNAIREIADLDSAVSVLVFSSADDDNLRAHAGLVGRATTS